ncbi:MAG: prolyl oligopeptidase family serine peptidase [Bacteroidota bacterium]
MNKILLISIAFFILTLRGYSQKTFNIPEVYYEWNQIKNATISSGGKVITYEKNKLKGDGSLHIHIPSKNIHDSISRADQSKTSYNETFVAFKINPSYDSIRKLKLDDVSKKKYPKDSLGVYLVNNNSLKKFARVKSYKIPEKGGSWIAYLHEKETKGKAKEQQDSVPMDSLGNDSAKNDMGQRLVLFNPLTDFELSFFHVKDYCFSENGKLLLLSKEIEQKDREEKKVEVIKVHLPGLSVFSIFSDKGKITDIAAGPNGEHHAFIHTADTTDNKDYALYFDGKKIADSSASFLFDNWQISAYSNLYFSKAGQRLFFETAPRPDKKPEDTLTDDQKYHVDVWNWKDKHLQPQQKKQKKRNLQQDYKAFYSIKNKEFTQVEDTLLEHVYILKKQNSRFAYGFSTSDYERQRSWNGRRYRDIFHLDLKKHRRKRVLEKQANSVSYSPSGRYIAFYNENDSIWYAMDTKKDKTTPLTHTLKVPFYREKHDMPVEASAYGAAGWDKQDNVYLYDAFNIWKCDAKGKRKPENITSSENKNQKIRYRYKNLDNEQLYIGDTMLLKTFSVKTKDAGFAYRIVSKQHLPKTLYRGPYSYNRLKKARESNHIIFSKGNFQNYPNLYLSTLEMKELRQLSNINPQQKKYRWGSVELTNWVSNEGDSISGLIYKPENFDPQKQYPMLVYFYERYSDQLHSHYIPKPSHSVINFIRYINDGYIIFIPDIVYRTGYPGESAESAVISGTLHMVNQGYVAKERIGIQGQSWGGYQVAHLVTRTNLFAAAMAGAPVSNMTSAYGGIRWGSGQSRAFQYEQTQSRIGGSLWEKPLEYIENSPVFHAPNVETPLLMMHNDDDGAVPWYQSIEFFNALRRLNKETYLLVYNNDKHNLRHWGNRIDLSIRMKQFFDHHLKDAPMPSWMKYGLPATQKGKKTGYQLTD